MKNNNTCKFCKGRLVKKDGCYVCEKCKAIVYSDEIGVKDFLNNTEKDIERVQNYLEKISDVLHIIEQNYMDNVEMSKEKLQIRDNCIEFHDCSSWIKTFIKDDVGVSDEDFCKELYRMNEIKKAFSDAFTSEKHETEEQEN